MHASVHSLELKWFAVDSATLPLPRTLNNHTKSTLSISKSFLISLHKSETEDETMIECNVQCMHPRAVQCMRGSRRYSAAYIGFIFERRLRADNVLNMYVGVVAG